MDQKLMFPLSSELKSALGSYATKHGMSLAEVIRTAIAKEIGFKLEPTQTHKKYASEAERIEAQKARKLAQKTLIAQLLKEHAAKKK